MNSVVIGLRRPFDDPMMTDATTSTVADQYVTRELARHVIMMRKISLIAEEFNRKNVENGLVREK